MKSPQVLATLISAILCGMVIYFTKGEHGIGWFIFSLFCIW